MLVGLEIKVASQVGPADAEGIRVFQQSLGQEDRFRCGVILHGGEQARPLGERVYALPRGWLLPRLE